MKDPKSLNLVLVTDCGSTTTKALLFEKTDQGWHTAARGEAPTTVEEPIADVTIGALNAFAEIEELSKRKIVGSGNPPFLELSADKRSGIDLFLSTSSAGGGLQMLVMGAVKEMTTQSAERAALGAGAIVMDAISVDDGREDHERIERIRHIKPDIVLLSGGVDGGSRTHVNEMAELLLAANPRPRFGDTLKLPVIFAGNRDAAEDVENLLKNTAQVEIVANLRPTLDREVLGPARAAIHEFFLGHVMSHSPGYSKLLAWTPAPILPTPAAVGNMVQDYGTSNDLNVLCVDIGGATTDVFSLFKDEHAVPAFNRTVSANLGMSYSIGNVLLETGVANIKRWLCYQIDDEEIRNRIRNKMIRPTTLPQTKEDLWLEQAVAREALRLSLVHHRSLAIGLSGMQRQRSIGDIFFQTGSREELVNMLKLDLVIGSGGVLSHAPQRNSAAIMMIDAFELEGFTRLAVDSVFMLPHLGVLASVNQEAAREILLRDCLVNLGCSVCAKFSTNSKSDLLADVLLNGQKVSEIRKGQVSLVPSRGLENVELQVIPLAHDVDIGAGAGNTFIRSVSLGLSGLFLDGRGRPIRTSSNSQEQIARQRQIYEALGLI